MRQIFKNICVPLMLINNNAYTFISGILLSFSTGTVTSLCLEKTSFFVSWHLYCSSILHMISGALLIYVATQITSYQNYIASNQIIDKVSQKDIICDFEIHRCGFWMLMFLILLLSLLFGTVFLFLNYII